MANPRKIKKGSARTPRPNLPAPLPPPPPTPSRRKMLFSQERDATFGQDHLTMLLIYAVSSLVEYKLRDKINATVFGGAGSGGGPRLLVSEDPLAGRPWFRAFSS